MRNFATFRAGDRATAGLSLLLFATLSLSGCEQQSTAGAGAGAPPVTVAYPIEKEVTNYEDYTGRTAAIDSVQVTARVTGYLDKIYFLEGAEVKEGTVLYEIDPRPYQAAYDQAKAQVAQSQAALTLAKANRVRYEELFQKKVATAQDVETYRSQEAQAAATLAASQANLETARLNLGWTKVTAPVAGRLGQTLVSRGNLVTADQTKLTTMVSLDPMYVYFDVDEQNMLKVHRLVREGKIKAKSEKEVPVLFGLSDEAPNFPHNGTVDFTDNRVDINTGSLRFRAKVDNEKGILTPGLFVRVRLPIGDPHETLFVREEALASDQGRKIVYTVEWKPVFEDGKPVYVESGTGPDKTKEQKMGWIVAVKPLTKVGSLRDGFRAIEAGLAPTDKVIVTGLQKIRPGKEVKATEKPLDRAVPKDLSFNFRQEEEIKLGGGTAARDTRKVSP
jgi:RND family efflux transporter MFP subunit